MPSNTDPKPMKSRLGATIRDNRESEDTRRLCRHFQDLLTGLDDPARDKCMSKLGELRDIRTKQDKEALIDSFAYEDAAQRARIEHSLFVLNFLIDELLSDGIPAGDHQLWPGDFETAGFIDRGSRRVFEILLKKLVDEYLPTLRVRDRRRRTEAGVLPNFKSLGITVEARAVKKARYKWGMPLGGADAYRPEIVGTAMIASVHVGVDTGLPEDFHFQMGETDIDDFMSSLAAAKMEITALRSYLNLDSEGIVKRDE